MLKRYRRRFLFFFKLGDACALSAAWFLSYALRFYLSSLYPSKGVPELGDYGVLIFLILPVWFLVFSALGIYTHQSTFQQGKILNPRLFKAHGLSLIFFIVLTYFMTEYRYSRGVLLWFGAVGFLSLISARILFYYFFLFLGKKGIVNERVAYVGQGRSLEKMIELIQKNPSWGLFSVGFFSPPGVSAFSKKASLSDLPFLGKATEIPALLKKYHINQILIGLPLGQIDQTWRTFFKSLNQEPVEIHLVPDWDEETVLGCTVDFVSGIPIVHFNSTPFDGDTFILKRVLDVIGSSLALLLFSPLLLLIAFLVKKNDGGPVLYRQERMGLDGKIFEMLKFRSMKIEAEALSGPIWASASDDRKTRLGNFLRKTSLDELPQFWNVLKGDMSLVGPRPERPFFVKEFREKIPHYMLRHKVKAGITGWAQVQGWRGNTSLEKRIECDLYYIRHWSLWLDIWILWLTIWKGFVHKNAY